MRTMRLLAAFLAAFFVLAGQAQAKLWAVHGGLTGGGAALDGIDTSGASGYVVNDGDIAVVYGDNVSLQGYFDIYHFISADSTAENPPRVVAPDTGTGRWHLSKSSYNTVTFALENCTSSENYGSVRFDHDGTIINVNGVIRGSGTSVTVQVMHGSDRSATGTPLFASPQAITSKTTGTTPTIDGTATFSAGHRMWMTTTAVSGTVNLELTITYVYHY